MGATLKMAELTTAAGLPRPEIEDARGCVTVRFRHEIIAPVRLSAAGDGRIGGALSFGRQGAGDLSERQQAILALLDHVDRPLVLREIRGRPRPQTTKRQLRGDLAFLKAKGLIAPTGYGRGARWTRS